MSLESTISVRTLNVNSNTICTNSSFEDLQKMSSSTKCAFVDIQSYKLVQIVLELTLSVLTL